MVRPRLSTTVPSIVIGWPGSVTDAMRARDSSVSGLPWNTASHPSHGNPTIGSLAPVELEPGAVAGPRHAETVAHAASAARAAGSTTGACLKSARGR
jgi:hypothetical protein